MTEDRETSLANPAVPGDWLPQRAALNRAAAQPALQHLQAQVAILIRLLDEEFTGTDTLIIAENHTITSGLLDVHARTPLRLISYCHTLDGWERVSVSRHPLSLSLLDCGPAHLQDVLRADSVGPAYQLGHLRHLPETQGGNSSSLLQALHTAVQRLLPWYQASQRTATPIPATDNLSPLSDLDELDLHGITSIERLYPRPLAPPDEPFTSQVQDDMLNRMSDP